MEQHAPQSLGQNQGPQPASGVRRAWQRPTLQRLHVSLDTKNGSASASDAGGQTT